MQKTIDPKRALATAVRAAHGAGTLMRTHLNVAKRANEVTQHDIKLELDVRSQKLIEKMLLKAFPQSALLGEEGIVGDPESEYRWVVDPIDGTVNFAYTIPHASVSIALQHRPAKPGAAAYEDGYETVAGVVYDPFMKELWTGIRGQPARLNGKLIHVSKRRDIREGMVSIGFAKTRQTLMATLPYFNRLVHRVRKIRIMGSAAISLAYVGSGRFDAYIEAGIRLWDIAAGGLIVECAGGEFWRQQVGRDYRYRMIASNGLLRRHLRIPGKR